MDLLASIGERDRVKERKCNESRWMGDGYRCRGERDSNRGVRE